MIIDSHAHYNHSSFKNSFRYLPRAKNGDAITAVPTAHSGGSMTIFEVTGNKKEYLPLLLLADEQEDMIDRYLEKGTMYALEDGGVRAECVVTDEGEGVLELKNMAVDPEHQRKGYGKALVNFLIQRYTGQYRILQVSTGDSPMTIPFYESCGFTRAFTIPNFFTDNYDHPIWECGVQLVDMVYLRMDL